MGFREQLYNAWKAFRKALKWPYFYCDYYFPRIRILTIAKSLGSTYIIWFNPSIKGISTCLSKIRTWSLARVSNLPRAVALTKVGFTSFGACGLHAGVLCMNPESWRSEWLCSSGVWAGVSTAHALSRDKGAMGRSSHVQNGQGL